MSLSTVDVNGVTHGVYATVAEADGHLAVDPTLGPIWAAKTEEQKKVLLVASTRRLDMLDWVGEKAGGSAQKNAWPRKGVKYPDGTDVPDDELPYEVEVACSLLAGAIAQDPKKANAGSSGSNIKAVGAGSARVEFFRPTDGVPLQDPTVFGLVAFYLSSGQGGGLAAGVGYGKATGTDSCPLPAGYGDLDKGYA